MAEFITPQKPVRFGAFTSNNKKDVVSIPPSPFLQKLGYGTGVTVYKMERSPLINKSRSPWAIKKVSQQRSKEIQQRLQTEADILRKLNHPNIVGFRAFVKSLDGRDCLAMEECASCLGDLIENRKEEDLLAYEPKRIMRVASDIAKALDYLHNTSLLLHGDIKSSNILIKGNFEVCKVCDFGVSLPLRKDGYVDKEKTGDDVEYCGTTIYSACEVLQDNAIITTKADIFSYGLVIWEMLALCPPHCYGIETNIDESETDDSLLDISSADESVNVLLSKSGKRPPLPNQEFGEEYVGVLEVFYCCTNENFKERPSAKDLCLILES